MNGAWEAIGSQSCPSSRVGWLPKKHKARVEAEREDSSSAQATLQVMQSLPRRIWCLILALGMLYGALFPFETIASDFFREAYGLGPVRAGG